MLLRRLKWVAVDIATADQAAFRTGLHLYYSQQDDDALSLELENNVSNFTDSLVGGILPQINRKFRHLRIYRRHDLNLSPIVQPCEDSKFNMAVSPLPIRSPAKAANLVSSATRSLAVRGTATTTNGSVSNMSTPTQNSGLDLSEQLNEEEKRKYVKGKDGSFSINLFYSSCLQYVLTRLPR
jgi:hypothetical protein